MALFRKFFYRKPPDGLLEISERVYVFDCCFTTDILEDDEYKVYMGGIVDQLRDHLPDASFMVFNFREGENQSEIANILSEYDMTVMDYPRQYEGCPLLTMEMIHHFLRSSESWLLLGQQNVLLMHCERGGWPVLAFMLAALLIYRKQFTVEQKTLEMIYKQAPRELLQLLSPLNPLPSQLRYLQYVSRRNVGSEWPPLDRALTLDCVILRAIPNMDGEWGCRPIFRIYGQDPFMAADRTPKVLFSTPKKSKLVQHYKQADCELVKIDIHCHIQGDVVLECISLDSDHERESMMFRVMFNTAFIRSNILMLNRDEIDILWDAKDQFPKDYRAEVLFSEKDSATSLFPIDLPDFDEKDGLPMEAFAKVQEIFSIVDWLDPKADVALNVLQHITGSNILQENLESSSLSSVAFLESTLEKVKEKQKIEASDSTMDQGKQSSPAFNPPSKANSIRKKIEPHELQVALQRPAQSKIIYPRASQSSLSTPASYSNSLQGSPVPISRYHSAPSALGITALLQDHAASNREKVTHEVTSSPTVTKVCNPVQFTKVSTPSPAPPPPASHVLQTSVETTRTGEVTSAVPPPPFISVPPQPTSKATHSSRTQYSGTTQKRVQSSSIPPSPPTLPSLSGVSCTSTPIPPPTPTSFPSLSRVSSTSTPPPPPPPPSFPGASQSPSPLIKNSFPVPPPPPSTHPALGTSPSLLANNSFSSPPPPPLPPGNASSAACLVSSPQPMENLPVRPPPPPPPPLHSQSVSGPNTVPSAPHPPPPPSLAPKGSLSNNSAHVPPVPPPPAPFAKGKAGGAQPHVNGNVPPIPGPPTVPFNAKGRGLSRTSPKNQAQARKANLKPYHWLKLTRAMQGSLWAETQKSDEASKAPEFDMSELESLFSAAAPNSDHANKGAKSNRRATGPKSEKVQLVELRRAYNCEIMLTKVKIPLPDLMSSVLALDDSALDVDQVDNLIKFCPTKEEMDLIKGYTGDKENLGKCEQFFLELMKVPRVESKLRVFSFKIQFHTQVSDLRNSLNVVNSAAEEVRNSAKLKRIMQTILSLGNALNHGTARGSAIGFRLDSLLKLTDTRARNNKMTLMHYLCKVLAHKLPDLLDFPKDLVSLEAATKIQLKYLAEEMQAISKGLEKVVQELAASQNDGLVSENFCKILKEFLSFAEGEVRSLASLYSSVGRSADALALYFGEDPARCPFEQVVSTLLNFVRMFVRAHEENCKKLEFEKKKAQKDAENEKLKSVPKKESQKLIGSPIKSGSIK
ncbi:FH2 domain-containing protein/PTEN_C2 domain-containing protein [Cephalotus follicularis]|uniref:Formin-like protein n=1 Tax=Cephalotus follicularis TaxID=3775 RepID=A0A1Q3CU12_CEPFO|nr:FH2 domain-containing protein/PTEN_C2 domain-containing protein [Cephalotus follicularis]